jgi:acyl transferase domain-containing protein
LERKTIAPNIFFDSPNPKISFEDAKLKVPTSVLPWPADRLPRASVNCFGIGGANAHVILDSKDSYFENHGVKQRVKGSQPEGSRLIVVSAKCVQSLQQQIEAVSHYLNKSPDSIHDLAYTLGVRREHFQHRAFAVSSPGKPIDAGSFHKGEKVSTKLTFVFTGQGAQWAEMGKDLIDTFDSFRDDIKELDCFLQELEHSPSWTLQG